MRHPLLLAERMRAPVYTHMRGGELLEPLLLLSTMSMATLYHLLTSTLPMLYHR